MSDAIADGSLALDEPAPLPLWQRNGDPRSLITVRELLQMRSGLKHVEESDPPYEADTVRMLFLDGRDVVEGTRVGLYATVNTPPSGTDLVISLSNGQSITIPRRIQHRFWGEKAPVFVGEVSECNDDLTDNYFLEPIGRFSDIIENEAPYRLLWNEALG